MFELLRSWIKPIIIVTLLFFVSLIILEWGAQISSGDRYSANTAAAGVVNGQDISRDRFNQVYNELTRQQFADPDNPPSAAQIQRLKSQAWTAIVNDISVLQEIAKQGIEVSDQDMYYYLRYNPPAFLQRLPQFQTDGTFDYQIYLQIMAAPANAPMWASIEEVVFPQVQMAKMREVVTAVARVTREEIRRSYLHDTELGKFNIALVNIKDLKDAAPTPSDQEINEYYQSHVYRFQNEQHRNISLVLFSKDITESDWMRVRGEAQEYSDMARGGDDFGELAALYSEGPSAADSGALGYIGVSGLDTAYVNGALQVAVGEVTGPVRSSFGWHVIKLLGIKDTSGAEITSTEDRDAIADINTSHLLIKVTSSDETLDNSEAAARSFKNRAAKIGFAEAAGEMSLEIKQPFAFKKSDAIQFIGSDYFASEWVFTSEIGDISGIYENPSNFFVMSLSGIKAEGPIPLADIRSSIENLVRNEKLKDMAMDTARLIYQELADGTDFRTACKNHGVKFITTGQVSRKITLPPPIGQDPKASGAMFSISEIDEYTEPVRIDRGAAIFQLLDIESPGLDDFEAAKDSVAAALLQSKQAALWNNWYRIVTSNAVSMNYLERQIADQRAIDDSTFF